MCGSIALSPRGWQNRQVLPGWVSLVVTEAVVMAVVVVVGMVGDMTDTVVAVVGMAVVEVVVDMAVGTAGMGIEPRIQHSECRILNPVF